MPSNARNLADIVTGNFDVPLGALDNVPPSNDASALTTGTLPVGRLPSSGVDASSLTTGTLPVERLPSSGVDASSLTTGTIPVDRIPYLTNRNRIINGNFDIWQRGTSFSTSGVNDYSADRFRTEGYGLSTTISRQAFTAGQTDVPHFPTYFCRVVTSTIASGQFWAFQQRIEMPQVLGYGQTGTFSFWVRATTGTLPVGAFAYGFGGQFVNSPELTTTWQKITGTFTAPTSGNYGSFYLMYLGADKAAISVDIAQVQLEEGSVATPFEHVDYSEMLHRCQRYFEKSFEIGTPPTNGGSTTSFSTDVGLFFTTVSHNNTWRSSHRFAVPKRATPVMGTYGNSQGYWNSYVTGWSANNRSITPDSTGFRPRQQASGSVIDVHGHWTADAEL